MIDEDIRGIIVTGIVLGNLLFHFVAKSQMRRSTLTSVSMVTYKATANKRLVSLAQRLETASMGPSRCDKICPPAPLQLTN